MNVERLMPGDMLVDTFLDVGLITGTSARSDGVTVFIALWLYRGLVTHHVCRGTPVEACGWALLCASGGEELSRWMT